MKEHVLRVNINLISFPYCVARPSYPFSSNFGRTWKGSFAEKAKIVDIGSLCIARQSTCSKLQYDPYLISVPCSYTELSISGKIWISCKGSFTEEAEIVDSGSLCSTPENTSSKLQYEACLFSVACS